MAGVFHLLKVDRQQFAKPAVRAPYLWIEVLFLVMAASELIFLTAFFGLQIGGLIILMTVSPLLILILLWFGIVRVHQVVHEAYVEKWNDDGGESKDDPRINMLLDKLAYLSYPSFNYAVTAVIVGYGALVPTIVQHH